MEKGELCLDVFMTKVFNKSGIKIFQDKGNHDLGQSNNRTS